MPYYLDIEGKLRKDGELIDFNNLEDYEKEEIADLLNSGIEVGEIEENREKVKELEETTEEQEKTLEAYSNFMNNMCREFRELVPQLILTLYSFDEVCSNPKIAPILEKFFETNKISTKWDIDILNTCLLKLCSFGSTFAISHPTDLENDSDSDIDYAELYRNLRPILSKIKIEKLNG